MTKHLARVLLILGLVACIAVAGSVAMTSAQEAVQPPVASIPGEATGVVQGELMQEAAQSPAASIVAEAAGVVQGELAPAAIPSGGPGFVSLNSMSFVPWPSNGVPYSFNGRTLFNPDASSHAYEAVVQLPHGATINKFVVWYYDNHANDLWAALARMALDDASVAQIGRVDSTGASANIRYAQDTSILTPVVNNEAFTYWVEAFLPPSSTGGIVSFRVDYTYPVNIPMAVKN